MRAHFGRGHRSLLCAALVTTALTAAAPASEAAPAVSGHRIERQQVAPPPTPFVTNVIAEGLAALVSWAPDPAASGVQSYTLNAAVSSGYAGTVPAGCSSPPAVTVSEQNSGALVGSLCAGIPYVFTVTATNAGGSSPASLASNPVAALAAQPPGQPSIIAVQGRQDSLLVTWTAPDLDGGDSLGSYDLTATSGSSTLTLNPAANADSATISGLTDGTTYQISLQATTAAGTSTASQSSGTPSAGYTPSPPLGLRVTPDGAGDLDASWSAPADDGGSTVSGYVLSYVREVLAGGRWKKSGATEKVELSASTLTYQLASVAAQDFYSVSIAAVNAVGTGSVASTPNPVAPTVTVSANTVVLTSATMSDLTSSGYDQLQWSAPVPAQISALHAGDIIVGSVANAAPNGLLAKVVSVSVGSSGAVVETTAARLTDAFTSLSLNQSVVPSVASGLNRFQPVTPGVRVMDQRPADISSSSYSLAVNLQNGPLTVAASVNLTPSFTFGVEINHGFADVPDGITAYASAALQFSVQGSVSLTKAQKTWYITTFEGEPIPLDIAGVPIILVPEMPVFVDLTGSISINFSLSSVFGMGIGWSTSDPGSLTSQNLSKPPVVIAAPTPGVSVSASAGIAIQFYPEVEIDDATGPFVEIEAGLNATVNFGSSPFFKIAPYLSLKAGWDIDFNVGPLQYFNTLSVTLAKITFPGFEIGTAPDADLTISPADATVTGGHQQSFSAQRSDGQVDPVSWSILGAVTGESINSNGVLTTTPPAGTQFKVLAIDSTGAQGETTVFIGGQPNPPSSVTAKAAAAGTSATVAWSPPADTGGYPLSGYTLATQPPTRTLSLGPGVRSTTLAGLVLGTSYEIDVYALNSGHLTSAAASAFLVTPAPGSVTGVVSSRAPLPVDAAANPDATVASISCASAGSCVGVGSYITTAGELGGLIETQSGGSWSDMGAPLPDGTADGMGTLDSVSCPAAGNCIAVGTYADPGGYDHHLVETLSDGTWTPSEAPLPTNTTSDRGFDYSDGLVCLAAGSCTDVTYDTVAKGAAKVVVLTLAKGTWKAAEEPLPADTQTGVASLENFGIHAVSCASPSTCVAFISYDPKDSVAPDFFETLSGGKWAADQPPTLSGQTTYPSGTNCSPGDGCAGIGADSDGTPVVYSLQGSQWSVSTAPFPSNAASGEGSGGALSSLSCAPGGYCAGFGSYEDTNFDGDPLLETISGDSASATELPLPSNSAPIGSDYGSLAISYCSYADSCIAVGSYTPATSTASPELVDSVIGGSATAAELSTPAGLDPTTFTPTTVTCAAAGACVISGSAGNRQGDYFDVLQDVSLAVP